jgi:hypothetical protein
VRAPDGRQNDQSKQCFHGSSPDLERGRGPGSSLKTAD